jgi:hypothetical protein
MWEARFSVNALGAAVLGFAAFLLACEVIRRIIVKPTFDLLRDLLEAIRDVKALIEPDETGKTLPQRVTTLESAFADFLSKLGPMIETIAQFAGPPRRHTKGTSP